MFRLFHKKYFVSFFSFLCNIIKVKKKEKIKVDFFIEEKREISKREVNCIYKILRKKCERTMRRENFFLKKQKREKKNKKKNFFYKT